jgi:hypothetical protein
MENYISSDNVSFDINGTIDLAFSVVHRADDVLLNKKHSKKLQDSDAELFFVY